MKNQFYQIWSYYISLLRKFYTDLKIQKNLWKSIFESICCWIIKVDPPKSGSTILTFHKEYLKRIVQKRDLNDLHSYKNIFGQIGLVYRKHG